MQHRTIAGLRAQLAPLHAAMPYARPLTPEQEAHWLVLLGEIRDDDLDLGIRRWIATEERFPTMAGLQRAIREARAEERRTSEESAHGRLMLREQQRCSEAEWRARWSIIWDVFEHRLDSREVGTAERFDDEVHRRLGRTSA